MSEHDLMRIRRVGDRLRCAFRGLVEGFPPGARNISGMSRWLDIHKATCQRIVEGLDPARDGLAAFSRLPGAEGLRMIISAASTHGVHPDLISSASAAVDEYQVLLADHGRTQRGLVRIIESLRIAAAGPEGQPDRDLAEDQRKALFDAARRASGEELRGKSVVAILRPRPEHAARLEATLYIRLVGAKRHSYSRPIVLSILSGWWSHFGSPDEPAGSRPAGVPEETPPFTFLPEWSTTGVKSVQIGSGDSRTLIVAELESAPSDGDGLGPADVAGRFRSSTKPNPLWDPRARLNCAVRISTPARAMLLDVFLHRTLAEQLTAQMACYSVSAPPGDSPEGGPDHCWYERFPDLPVITEFNPAEPPRPNPIFARHDELIRHAFNAERLDPADFAGRRAESAYPIWQSEYRMYFEAPRQEDAD